MGSIRLEIQRVDGEIDYESSVNGEDSVVWGDITKSDKKNPWLVFEFNFMRKEGESGL